MKKKKSIKPKEKQEDLLPINELLTYKPEPINKPIEEDFSLLHTIQKYSIFTSINADDSLKHLKSSLQNPTSSNESTLESLPKTKKPKPTKPSKKTMKYLLGHSFKVPPPRIVHPTTCQILPKIIKPIKAMNSKQQYSFMKDILKRSRKLIDQTENKQPYILNNRREMLFEFIRLRRIKERITQTEFLRRPTLTDLTREMIIEFLEEWNDVKDKADKYLIRMRL